MGGGLEVLVHPAVVGVAAALGDVLLGNSRRGNQRRIFLLNIGGREKYKADNFLKKSLT